MQHPLESRLNPLPMPAGPALELSRQLQQRLRDEAGPDGRLAFDRFMELALYAPGLGYYSNGLRKFGEGGDFVTAPELTPLFGRCLARQCAETLRELGGGDILEFGAGSGRLALDLLSALRELEQLPGRYRILELSAELRQRQRALLAERPELLARVEWLERLPDGFSGLILANEVVDAMPVSRFRLQEGAVQEQFLVCAGETLRLQWQPAQTPGLVESVQTLAQRYGLAEGYESEVCLRAGAWLASLGACLQRGLALLIDYGYSGREYYHPQRHRGTLACHYRQRVHGDPLFWPGLQDITAQVDFTALAEAATAVGFDSQAFTSQAYFLLGNGIEQLLPVDEGPQRLRDLQAVKRLTLPNDMGESFKVLGLGKGLERLPSGFRLRGYPL